MARGAIPAGRCYVSNRLLTLAKSAPIKGSAKTILIVLAETAGEDGDTWQSVETLAQWTGKGCSTVWRHVSSLVEMGLVQRRRRRNTTSVLHVDESAIRSLVDGCGLAPVIGLKTADQRNSHIENSQTENSHSENSRIGNPELSNRQVAYKDEPSLNPHSSSHAKKRTKPAKPKPREHPLPADWQPTDEHRDRATRLGLTLGFEAEQFRLHAQTHNRKATIWNSAFTSWLNIAGRREAERLGARASPAVVPANPEEWLRDEWRAGRVTEIHRFYASGYTQPAARDGDYWTDVLKPYNRQWITDHRDAILARLTSEAS